LLLLVVVMVSFGFDGTFVLHERMHQLTDCTTNAAEQTRQRGGRLGFRRSTTAAR